MSDFHEIKRLIEAQGDAWEKFKQANDTRLKNLEDENVDLAKKLTRVQFSGGGGAPAVDPEHKQAFMAWMRSGRDADLQTKSMSAGSDPDGGYMIPTDIDDLLTKSLRELSPMRQIARVVKADSGDFNMIHSIGGTGYSWVGETAARPETASPSLKKISPVIGEIYANPGLTATMLDDSYFDLENWIIEELAEAFGAGEGEAFISGDGIVKPRGILTYDVSAAPDSSRTWGDVQYVASGASGAFATSAASDKLVKLVHSLKPRYRQGASWLLNTSTAEQVRTLKNGDGDYIWKAGLEAGQPDRLLGYPVFEDENMPDVAANSLSIAFGNFLRGYVVVDRTTTMLRDPFTNKPFVHFYSSRRVGGTVRDFNAIKLMKFAAS